MSTAQTDAPWTARTVWTSPDGRYRLCARDWEDGHPPSYFVMARGPLGWSMSVGDQERNALWALAELLDRGQLRAGGQTPAGGVSSD